MEPRAPEYVHQEAFEWPVALYLYLGGMGGALISLGVILNFFRLGASLSVLAAFSGIVALAVAGVVLIFFDLVRPLNAIYSLSRFPHSGISWDVVLLSLAALFGLLFSLPQVVIWPGFSFWRGLAQILAPWQGFLGLVAFLSGALFPLVSGGLLAEPVSIPLWHTPALPLLMIETSYSAALAWITLFEAVPTSLGNVFWGINLALLTLTAATVFSYQQYVKHGPREAQASGLLLARQPSFTVGYLGLGLVLPLVLAAWNVFAAGPLSLVNPVAGAGILVGGYLLRHHLVYAGIYTYPWPY